MAGHDLDVDAPRYVPLEIDMQVCARREYFRADVKRALLDVFSSRTLADGTRGVFHPDHFTFGQPLYLSRLYAAAYAVDGVESAKISLFQRLGTPDAKPLADGRLDFARLEIARLDNDPSLPERGVFRLNDGRWQVSSALDDSVRGLSDCGCCSGLGPSTPGVVFNRPGLSAIAYRSATWHEFKASLTAALSSGAHPELAGLTTRDGDDFSIALLDAVAVLGDVLTFYQERIANESYLRTATERRSLLELARLIGYELKGGAAAETWLAFTVEDSPGAPRVATVDVGVKVQSVPGRDEKPQTFETVEKIEARAEWNAMRPKLTAPQTLGTGATDLWLDGTATDLKSGDAVLLVGPEREGSVADEHWDARRILSVKPDFDAKRTRVVFGPALGSTHPASAPSSAPRVYAMRTRAGVFGQNAANWRAMSEPFRTNYGGTPTTLPDGSTEWPEFTLWSPGGTPAGNSATLDLDQVYPAVLPDSWLLLATPDYVELFKVTRAVSASRAQFGLAGKTTRVTIEGENFGQFTTLVRSTVVYAAERGAPARRTRRSTRPSPATSRLSPSTPTSASCRRDGRCSSSERTRRPEQTSRKK